MKIVIELSREDLIAALAASEPVKTEVSTKGKTKGAVKEEELEVEAPKAKPGRPSKKVEPTLPPEEEEFDETEEIPEEEEAEEPEEEEFITGDELKKLKAALNAHKAAQGGKPKKTLEILRKFAPGGSEKVKPDVLPALLKALKV